MWSPQDRATLGGGGTPMELCRHFRVMWRNSLFSRALESDFSASILESARGFFHQAADDCRARLIQRTRFSSFARDGQQRTAKY